ncbi:MAG: DUF4445 domain-containing protein [Bacteroidetes bacterium]|nr:DUF4445 domain-containing protein [Bacteroidota bacterium]
MPIITFHPSGKSIKAAPGTALMDCAALACVEIQSPCGGNSSCGRCAVRIISGDTDSESLGVLTAEAVKQGYVLACRTKVKNTDLTVIIPEPIGRSAGQFTDAEEDAALVDATLFPQAWQLRPLTVKHLVTVPPPQPGDGLSDLDRLIRSIREIFQDKQTECCLSVLKSMAGALRRENGKITVTVVNHPDRCRVIRVEPGECTHNHYGIAVDIGTTSVAVQLVHLPDGKIIGTRTDYNDQIPCGLDVISRINYAGRPDRLEELQKRILSTVNRLLEQLTGESGADINDICNAVVSGNTTMLHLLLSLPPEYIRLDPYTPTVHEAPFLCAGELGINIHPDAIIALSPCVGSYVGGDITAGLLCTAIAVDSEEICLFVDIGTNGELVIGNSDFLISCACSAGPAFEGGGIDHGMRAARGAIDNVEVDPDTGIATYSVIGKVKPKGMCGSGMISLIAGLFTTGWIDAAGKLNRDRVSPAIITKGRKARYTVVPADESGIDGAISVSEDDIGNVIRAKAAIYSACTVMLAQLGISFSDISIIYIAGGFGRFLDIEKTAIIGMTPDIDRSRFRYVGNSSLTGSYMALVSGEYRKKQLELAKRMTYIDIGNDPGYMDHYTAALFIPHTDPQHFPSVHALLKQYNARTGRKIAAERAVKTLRNIDMTERCPKLGLPVPQNGVLPLRMFAKDMLLYLDDFRLTGNNERDTGNPDDLILLLHYLLCDVPVEASGELIPFRELTGGLFYYKPFRIRSADILLSRFGNNTEQLVANLGRFDHEPVEIGDVGARIHAFGNIWLTLIYRRGDDEFPPAVDVLFDKPVKRVFNAEDATILAHRICIGLI